MKRSDLPVAVRRMAPSGVAFAVLTLFAAANVAVTSDEGRDRSMASAQQAVKACPAVSEIASGIADRRTPTSGDAAAIVAMARRAHGVFPDCAAPPSESATDAADEDDGYWRTRKAMEIAEGCPAAMQRANDAADDGTMTMEELVAVSKAASSACPANDAGGKTR